jgi:hypothetical protein
MNVDSSIAAAEKAISRPATRPAIGPPIDRASHQTTPMDAIPEAAMPAVAAVGFAPDSAANGASR